MARKPLSKKTRFEIFKRDSFTCQYCGRGAPEIVLHIDHIKPVADGGDNEFINLVTSCLECNLGKGARPLSDQTMAKKQAAQLKEINEQRQQFEMLLAWKKSLINIEDDYIEAIQESLSRFGHTANETGIHRIKNLLKKYGFKEVYDVIDISFLQYAKIEDGKYTAESWFIALKMVDKIINMRRSGIDPEKNRKMFYIRGILRNRVHWNERYGMQLLRECMARGFDMDQIEQEAKEVLTWSQWTSQIEYWLKSDEEKKNG